MNIRLACAAALFCAANGAGAQTLCEQIETVLKSGVQPGATVQYDPGEVAAKCSTSLSLGGQRSLNCAWGYAFRSDTSKQVFTSLVTEIADCFDGAGADLDQPVSHPDFYDLRVYRNPLGEVGVSLKDKGALQQTFVFLRITPVP